MKSSIVSNKVRQFLLLCKLFSPSQPFGRPGVVVDVQKSDGALTVWYPVIRKNVLLQAADVTKVTDIRGKEVMVVIDRYLIQEYHGESAIKVSSTLI